jgi:hypothetical protein
METKYARAEKIKVKNTPDTTSVIKFDQISVSPELRKIKGRRMPSKKLSDRETAKPRYCPRKIEDLLMGCASKSSMNSLEL